jgi:transcriptional regulator with XRE-family HTH domain
MRHMDWRRLGEEVERRRGQLGFGSRREFAEKTGFAEKTLGDVENGRRDTYSPVTISRLEAALRWPAGAVDAILRGEPVPPDLAAAFPPYTGLLDHPGGRPTYRRPVLVDLDVLLDPDGLLDDEERTLIEAQLYATAKLAQKLARDRMDAQAGAEQAQREAEERERQRA